MTDIALSTPRPHRRRAKGKLAMGFVFATVLTVFAVQQSVTGDRHTGADPRGVTIVR